MTKLDLGWSEDLCALVHPWRGDLPLPSKRRRASPMATVLKTARDCLPTVANDWREGEAHTEGDAKVLQQRALERIRDEPSASAAKLREFDPVLEGATAVIAVHAVKTTKTPSRAAQLARRIADHWIDEAGVVSATAALVAATDLRIYGHRKPGRPWDDRALALAGPAVRWNPEALRECYEWTVAPWISLRRALATAPETAYRAARALAEAALSFGNDTKLDRAARIAFAFPDAAAWTQGVIERRFAATECRLPLLACLDTREAVEQLLVPPTFFGAGPYAPSVVHKLGLDAWPIVQRVITRGTAANGLKGWAEATAVFVGAEPARLVASFLQFKTFRPLVARYFAAHPALAPEALAPLVAANSKIASIAEAILNGVDAG